MRGDLSDIEDVSLWVAGEAGQTALALSSSAAGLRAVVDQHEAEVRDALPGRLTAGDLMSYARGFVDAAVARGWWPASADSPWSADWSVSAVAEDAGWADKHCDAEGPCVAADCFHGEMDNSPGGPPGLAGLGFPGDDSTSVALRKLDWESLRLAAVCRLFLETQGLTP